MKRISFIFCLLIFFSCFVLGQPEVGVGESDVEKIEDVVDDLPFDDSGGIDFKPWRTKADERIGKINGYIGPWTKMLWGVELELSWVFVFSFIVWILMIEFIVSPMSEIFDWNIWWSLGGAFMVATLAMQRFGKDLVVWMTSFMTAWWSGLVGIVLAVIVWILYAGIWKNIGAYIDKMKKESRDVAREEDEAEIHAHAEASRKEMEGFKYEKGMHRGGSKSTEWKVGASGRKYKKVPLKKGKDLFVKKKVAERYARRYGSDAARKRFKVRK
jgi:hypothetical protein